MSFAYVDESIHVRGGFIVTAIAVSKEPLEEAVAAALTHSGYTAGHDEFKSSLTMAGNPPARALRERVQDLLLKKCKIAVAVSAIDERRNLASIAFELMARLVADPPIVSGEVYFDQGIARASTNLAGWSVRYGCDSRSVGGIQVADCAAHTVSMMLLAELGIVNKIVEAGPNYPESHVEMAWKLWTWLRYSLSSGVFKTTPVDDDFPEPWMKPFGLFVTDRCPPDVRAAADTRLSGVWLGCIH